MIKLEKKQVKIISVIIALVFIGSVVALALTQSGGIASAAGSNVGVIDQQQVLSEHPDAQSIEDQMNAALDEIKKDFDAKSAGMSDQEKQDYYRQCMQRAEQKRQELVEPLIKSVDEAIKKTADAKGLTVVIEKAAVIYGGQDITQDVIKNLTKK